MFLSMYWACGTTTVLCVDRGDLPVCVKQARPRFARKSVVALVPSTAGLASLGLLRDRRACC